MTDVPSPEMSTNSTELLSEFDPFSAPSGLPGICSEPVTCPNAGAGNPASRATKPSVPTMAVVVFNTALVANVPVISETVPVKRPRAQYREPIPA
jgi:hypothetical protein